MKVLRLILLVALLPFIVSFDTLMYWFTRPSCLTCGSLTSYIQSASLTAAMIAGSVGYSFKKRS